MKPVASIVLLAAMLAYAAEPPATRFVLNIPENIPSQDVEIRYMLTGTFGAYGGFVGAKKGVRSYDIDTSYEQKSATELRIIAYIPGCEFQTFRQTLSASKQVIQKSLSCRKLPMVKIEGQVDSSGMNQEDPELVVWYLADWDHDFMGIKDGMVNRFKLATPSQDAFGRFRTEIPDFSADPIGKNGSLVIQLGTGKDLAAKFLKIEPVYEYIEIHRE
jgi:hypothetical protein